MSLFNGLPYGLMNIVIGFFGIAPISWIATVSPPWYWLVLVTVRLWLQLGFYMIIFLAGLQDIPRSLYEAAMVDGARSGWATFRYITFPMLRNTSISVLMLLLIAAFQAFDEFYNILSTSNVNVARPPLFYLYQVSFTQQDFGRGDAGSFLLTGVIVLFTLVQGRLFGFGRSDR
jgi:multiple sugar transport system permease protein